MCIDLWVVSIGGGGEEGWDLYGEMGGDRDDRLGR